MFLGNHLNKWTYFAPLPLFHAFTKPVETKYVIRYCLKHVELFGDAHTQHNKYYFYPYLVRFVLRTVQLNCA